MSSWPVLIDTGPKVDMMSSMSLSCVVSEEDDKPKVSHGEAESAVEAGTVNEESFSRRARLR